MEYGNIHKVYTVYDQCHFGNISHEELNISTIKISSICGTGNCQYLANISVIDKFSNS